MTILLFTDVSWLGLHQRPHHIARALAKHWRILWVEPATKSTKAHFRPVTVAPNISVLSVPEIPYNARSAALRTIARVLSRVVFVRKFRSYLQTRLVRNAMNASEGEVGIIIQNFHTIGIVEKFHPLFVLFDYIDNAFGFTTFPQHVRDEWIATIGRADEITVTSPVLARLVEPYTEKTIHCIGNGVEYEHFSRPQDRSRPDDLPKGKPIVGYVGAVYKWLDYEFLRYAAGTMKEVNFVIIGPLHPDVLTEARSLEGLGNVFFPGARPYETIPRYLHNFDVCIIPFQKNDLTAAVNPVKLYEYSAAGKPTVATDFSEDILQYEGRILIARTKEEFVDRLKEALTKSRDATYVETLKRFAREHDWDGKTAQIIRLIQAHIH